MDTIEDWDGRRGTVRLFISPCELEWRFGSEAGLGYEEVRAGFDFTMREGGLRSGVSIGVDGCADTEVGWVSEGASSEVNAFVHVAD